VIQLGPSAGKGTIYLAEERATTTSVYENSRAIRRGFRQKIRHMPPKKKKKNAWPKTKIRGGRGGGFQVGETGPNRGSKKKRVFWLVTGNSCAQRLLKKGKRKTTPPKESKVKSEPAFFRGEVGKITRCLPAPGTAKEGISDWQGGRSVPRPKKPR